MNAQNPAPDPDTMLTLIETNDQLNIAMSKHQRAVLGARKATGLATPSPAAEPQQNPMAMPQHVPGQNVYGGAAPQSTQPDHGPYSASPPRRQNTVPNPVSPVRQEEEHFAPPPGPPPGRVQPQQNQLPADSSSNPYDFSNAGTFSNQFSAPQQPPVPTRSTARPQSHAYSSSADYGIADNPFADDAYGPGSPQKERALHTDQDGSEISSRPPQGSSGNQYPQELPSEHNRPGPYNAGYQPTPSYIHRQESSADHVTMHGGSPPPSATAPNGNSAYTASSRYESHPVSPIDDTQRRMNDMHI
jgi:hypothetical protein